MSRRCRDISYLTSGTLSVQCRDDVITSVTHHALLLSSVMTMLRRCRDNIVTLGTLLVQCRNDVTIMSRHQALFLSSVATMSRHRLLNVATMSQHQTLFLSIVATSVTKCFDDVTTSTTQCHDNVTTLTKTSGGSSISFFLVIALCLGMGPYLELDSDVVQELGPSEAQYIT